MDRQKILVVDDSDINRYVIETMLTDFDVLTASSANQMYEILEQTMVDLILLDIIMPEKDGLSVAKELADSDKFASLPIIFVSARNTDEDVVKGLNMGAYDYVTKPINEKILRARIDSVLRQTQKEKKLESQSRTDELTGIYNKRYFIERARQEWDLVKRQDRTLSIVLMDIDHFKRINDEYGHDVGDFILKELASLLSHALRLSDIVARYGGKKYIALFTGYSKEEAFLACLRIRKTLQSHIFKIKDLKIRITMTYGISDLNDIREHSEQEDIHKIINLADIRLHHGKKTGRDKISLKP